MSLTVALREELAHADAADPARLMAEAAALIDLAGTLRLRGGDDGSSVQVVVRCSVGAVARRLRGLLVDHLGHRPGLARRQGGNLRGTDGYLVEIGPDALVALGVLDDDGRPVSRDPATVAPRTGYLAGAIMAAGSLSDPGGPVHFEITAPRETTAASLAGMIEGARAIETRVVVKGGDAVADLLAEVGAARTFLAFDQGRMRRDLRRQVNRAVNADRANLRRATGAAAQHIKAIEAVVDRLGWDGLPDDLAGVALSRMANPEASLADLGELQDPPVGKATVHRRLHKIVELAQGDD